MMRRIANVLNGLALAAMPAARRMWGEAMKAELAYIDDDRSAVIHAGGCLVAAVMERGRDYETRFSVGMSSIAVATSLFAVFHIWCASRGVRVLLGEPDGFLNALLRSGVATTDMVARYEAGRPIVIACLFGLGVAHLTAAYFLHHRQLRRFLAASCAALAIAVTAVAIQLSIVWTLDGLPSEFVALVVQAVSVPLLLHWSNGRHLGLRSVE